MMTQDDQVCVLVPLLASELVELKGKVVVVMLVYHGSLINQIR